MAASVKVNYCARRSSVVFAFQSTPTLKWDIDVNTVFRGMSVPLGITHDSLTCALRQMVAQIGTHNPIEIPICPDEVATFDAAFTDVQQVVVEDLSEMQKSIAALQYKPVVRSPLELSSV